MRYAVIIDDSRETAESLGKMLKLLGYEVSIALGPRRGLESMTRRLPDVIFLDIHMQGVEGTEICRYIRRDPRTASVPVVVISSDTQETMIAQVREAGATAFIPKPIGLETLERTLQDLESPPEPGLS